MPVRALRLERDAARLARMRRQNQKMPVRALRPRPPALPAQAPWRCQNQKMPVRALRHSGYLALRYGLESQNQKMPVRALRRSHG